MNKIIFFVILQCFSFLFIKAQTCVDTSYKKNYISHQNSLINTVNFNIPNTSNSLLAGIIKGLDSALYITKVNNLGNILWAKKLKLNTYSSNRTIINVKVLNNNDIILQARIGDVYGNVTLICLSSIGNFKWVKSLNLNLDLNFDSPSLITDGKSLFVSSAIVDFVGVNSNFNNNAAAIKLDSNANLIFSKRYDQLNCGNVYPTCAINFGDSLIIAGRIEGSGACYNNDDNDEMNFFGFKVDLMNGNLGKSLGYKSPTQFGGATIPFLHYSGNFNNYNNDFYITGTTFKLSSQPNTKNGAYKIRIDSNLNYINGNWYSQNYNGNNIKPRIDFDNNGNTNILFSSNYSISATNVGQVFYTAKIDINNNSIRQKKINNSDLFATSDFAKPFSRKGNYLSIASSKTSPNGSLIELFQLSNDEQQSTCFGTDTSFLKIDPFVVTPVLSPFFNAAYDLPLTVTDVPTTVTDLTIIKTNLCQSISICSTLTVTPKIDTVCKVNNIYTYKANINAACKKHVNWIIDTAAISMLNIIDDTTVQIKFKKTWQGYLYANVNSCSVLKDSVKIAVYLSPDTINLSLNILSFCTTNAILLNAGSGFKSYRWQNGSIDSTFLATASGRYFVTAYDYCNNKFTDTIQLVKYITRPSVFLGNDTTLCNNTNNLLHAGIGYKTYAWSNGSSTEFININVPGIYSVVATDSCGIISRDTIDIKYFNLPTAVNLGADVAYCESKNYLFNAGSGYKNYVWQDGSTAQTFKANAIGKYYVTVTDSCGNKSSDTIFIKKTLYQPFKIDYPYLLCKADTAYINLSAAFKNYTWSPNNNSQLIGNTLMLFPNQSTLYNFTGETTTGCVLKDTMLLNIITCPTDIYFPNAFSPNGDGTNDKWKAISQKRILSYTLKIYNRYGQIIFTTSNINTGWNGMYKAEPQNAGTFIYACTYKVAGKPLQNVKGTILLFH